MSAKTEMLSVVPVNEGRDEGELMRDVAPNGETVQHQVNRTQRMIDKVYWGE